MSETIETAKELCLLYMKQDIPFWLTGRPGVGKSDLIKQIANELGIGFIDQRMGTKELVDLMGLPATVMQEGRMFTTWARPDFFPIPARDGKRGIFLIDELSDCNKPMQSALYQLFLNRRIGNHELPDGWYPCAAGNDKGSKAAAQTISTALANRFAHIDIEPCQKAFDKWANTAGIHHFVRAYLKAFPASIHKMGGGDPKKKEADGPQADMRAFPSPRSWAWASRICYAVVGEGSGRGSNESLLYRGLRGLIGDGEAGMFIAKFYRVLKMPELEEVLADPKKCFIPDEPSSRYAVAGMLAANADKANLSKIMQYVTRKQFGVELEICVMLDATQRDPTLCDTREYTEFGVRNKSIHA